MATKYRITGPRCASPHFSPLFVGATVATWLGRSTTTATAIISVPYSSGRPWQLRPGLPLRQLLPSFQSPIRRGDRGNRPGRLPPRCLSCHPRPVDSLSRVSYAAHPTLIRPPLWRRFAKATIAQGTAGFASLPAAYSRPFPSEGEGSVRNHLSAHRGLRRPAPQRPPQPIPNRWPHVRCTNGRGMHHHSTLILPFPKVHAFPMWATPAAISSGRKGPTSPS